MVTDVDSDITEQKQISEKKNTKQGKNDKNPNLKNLHLKKVKKNKKTFKTLKFILKHANYIGEHPLSQTYLTSFLLSKNALRLLRLF